MRLNKIFIPIALAAILGVAGFSSCKKSTFDINQNPNQVTDSTVTYNVILPAALHNTGGLIARDWGWLQNWLGYWSRSGTYAPNVIEETYQITTSFNTAVWNDLYHNSYDYQLMLTKAHEAGAEGYEAIGHIMRAHNFALLVDVYGDVPYTDALKGNANPTPKYDKGADIYKGLFVELDTAVALLQRINTSKSGPNKNLPSDDIVFGGAQFPTATIAGIATNWIKFSNTLRLRLLVHLMNSNPGSLNSTTTVPGFDIPGQLSKISANGAGFLTTDAQINPGYTQDKPNPFYSTYIANSTGVATANNVYYAAGEYGIGYYYYNGDARIGSFYQKGTNTFQGGYQGAPYGAPSNATFAYGKVAKIGLLANNGYNSPMWLLTAAESYLLQAEALYRGFSVAGTVASLYKTGVEKSFTFLGLTTANGDAYLSGNAGYPDVDLNAPDGGILTILTQKYFALNAIAPYEVWTDWRRTAIVYGADPNVGYDAGPPISVSPQLPSGITHIPISLKYPQTEYNFNSANVPADVAQGQFTRKIFWDLY
jgi:hypothetical protein